MIPGDGSAVTSSRTRLTRRVRGKAVVHRSREHVPIHGERAAAGHAGLVGSPQHERTQQTHLGFEQAVRIGRFGTLERVRAHQLGQSVGLVGRGAADGTHFVQHHVVAALSELPRGFRPGESAADDVDWGRRHECNLAPHGPPANARATGTSPPDRRARPGGPAVTRVARVTKSASHPLLSSGAAERRPTARHWLTPPRPRRAGPASRHPIHFHT